MSRRFFLLSVALGLLGTRTALAEDTDDLQALLSENVITTASTSAQKALTAPATSVTLTAEDLSRFGIRSLDEAINFLSLGVIAADTAAYSRRRRARRAAAGRNGKHFLVLVNGHAMNDPLYGAARFDAGAGMPIEIIDHIEVIVGPGLGAVRLECHARRDQRDHQDRQRLSRRPPARGIRNPAQRAREEPAQASPSRRSDSQVK